MTVEVIEEPEVSGEIVDRPWINQVLAGIDAKRWAVIIAEESSRLSLTIRRPGSCSSRPWTPACG